MYVSPEAQRLLEDVERAHQGLLGHFSAPDDIRRGLLAVRDALAAAVCGVSERDLVAAHGNEWSMAEVLVHVARHDHQYEEAHRRGLAHFVEHGLEHARQLWLLRDASLSPEGR